MAKYSNSTLCLTEQWLQTRILQKWPKQGPLCLVESSRATLLVVCALLEPQNLTADRGGRSQRQACVAIVHGRFGLPIQAHGRWPQYPPEPPSNKGVSSDVRVRILLSDIHHLYTLGGMRLLWSKGLHVWAALGVAEQEGVMHKRRPRTCTCESKWFVSRLPHAVKRAELSYRIV